RMLSRRPVLLTNLTALIAGYAMFGAFVLLPNFVETPRGLAHGVASLVHYGFDASSTRTGLYLLPGALAGFASGPLAGAMGRRWGSKWPLSLGVLFAGVGIASLGLWHEHPWKIGVWVRVLGGVITVSFCMFAVLVLGGRRAQ